MDRWAKHVERKEIISQDIYTDARALILKIRIILRHTTAAKQTMGVIARNTRTMDFVIALLDETREALNATNRDFNETT